MTDRELYLRMFRTMAMQREQPGSGHEAVSVGTTAALRDDDLLCPPYRALGAQRPERGTLHYGQSDRDVQRSPGPAPDTYAVAAGSAFAFKYRGETRIAIAYCAGACSSRGDFHEALDIASVLELPCVFVVDNDAGADLGGTAAGYGIAAETVDAADVVAVYEATRRAADRARAGEGPTLIDTVDEPAGRDPVEEFATKLTGLGYATGDELTRMREDARGKGPRPGTGEARVRAG